MPFPTSPDLLCFRLRAEIDGQLTTYALQSGANRIGSSSVNQVILPVPEISRQHAVLHLRGSRLEIEDLASKNGTFLNGQRIARESLDPGDRIGLGPVELVVEEVESADIELALVLGPPEEAGAAELSALPATRSTRLLGPSDLDAPLIEVFLAQCGPPEGDLSSALAGLRDPLALTGAMIVEWTQHGKPVVLASCGEIGHPDMPEALAKIEPDRSISETRCENGQLTAPLPLEWAAVMRPGQAPIGLILWPSTPGPQRPRLTRTLAWAAARLHGHPGPDKARRISEEGSEEETALRFPGDFVPGRSPAVERLYDEMRPLLRSDIPVLIEGETGVGKELIARILHNSSRRRRGPFIAINCAAIPATLLEAELFGIGEGVATGVRGRRGKFQLAEGGTLFLDELGEMALELQAKLLRALQEKEVHPVGGKSSPIDVRILAATNLDLLQRVEERGFRRDLYYRVAGFVLRVPALHQRSTDLPLLIESFLRRFAMAAGKRIRGVTVKALADMSRYPWPGNIRELENEIQRLVHSCPDGHFIDSKMLSGHIHSPVSSPDSPMNTLELAPHIEATERRLIRLALETSGGSQRKTAEILGISRNGLAQKMKRLGLDGSPPEPPRPKE